MSRGNWHKINQLRYDPPKWWIPVRAARQWPLGALQAATGPGLQERLQVSGGEWSRARDEGLSDHQADRWAVRVGTHPGLVWPAWFAAGLMPGDDIFVNGTATALPGWRPAYLYEEEHLYTERMAA